MVLAALAVLVGACSSGGPVADRSPPDRSLDARGTERRELRVEDAAREGADDVRPADRSPGGPLRVVTLNLHCLHDQPDLRAQGIALQLVKLDPDAVALQEICETVGSGGSDNMGTKIAAALKSQSGRDWQLGFAKTHVSWQTATFAGYDEGIGVLAPKGGVLSSGEQLLPQAKDFPRKVAWAKVGSPRGLFYLYSTHLTISSDWTERQKQVQSILTVVNTHLPDGLPQFVAGDFNDKDWSGPLTTMKAGPPAFVDAWATKNPGQPGNSIGCPSPSSRIDYIFVREGALKSLGVVAQLAMQYQGTCLSDHVGLWAQVYPK